MKTTSSLTTFATLIRFARPGLGGDLQRHTWVPREGGHLDFKGIDFAGCHLTQPEDHSATHKYWTVLTEEGKKAFEVRGASSEFLPLGVVNGIVSILGVRLKEHPARGDVRYTLIIREWRKPFGRRRVLQAAANMNAR